MTATNGSNAQNGSKHAYLYMLHPVRSTFTHDITPDEAMIMQAHFGYLKDLLSAGVLVVGGPCTDDGGAIAVAVIEAKNDAAAQAIVANDPAVKQGLAKPELHPFRLSLVRAG